MSYVYNYNKKFTILCSIFILLNQTSWAFDSSNINPQTHTIPSQKAYVLAAGFERELEVIGASPPYSLTTFGKTCEKGFYPRENLAIQSTKGNTGWPIYVLKGINVNYQTFWNTSGYRIRILDAYANPEIGTKQPIWLSWAIYCLPNS